MKDGGQPEPRDRRRAEGRRPEEHGPIDPDVDERGQAPGPRLEDAREPPGQAEAASEAEDTDESVLDKEGTDHAKSIGAEGPAHGRLPGASHRPGQQEVGHVGTGDDEHEEHRHTEDDDRDAIRADQVVSQRHHAEANVGVRVGPGVLQTGREGGELRLDAFDRAGGCQQAEAPEAPPRPVRGLELLGRGPPERGSGKGVTGGDRIDEALGRYADHGVAASVEIDPPSDDLGIAAVDGPPEGVAQDDDGFVSGEIVLRREPSAQGRRHPDQREEARVDRGPQCAGGLAVRRRQGHRPRAPGAHVDELPRGGPHVVQVGLRCGGEDLVSTRRLEHHQPVGVRVRERAKQRAVQDGVHGGHPARARPEGQDRDEDKRRGPREAAQGVAHVGLEGAHGSGSPG